METPHFSQHYFFDQCRTTHRSFYHAVFTHSTLLRAWRGPYGSRRFRLPEFIDSRHMKVVSLSAVHTGRLYPQDIYPWYPFLLVAGSTPVSQCGAEGLSKVRIPMTPSGAEPATFRLVGQSLDQLRHRIALFICYRWQKLVKGY